MKILVISPHADDEVLGCGAYIMDKSKQGHQVDVVIVTVGSYINFAGNKQSREQKLEEIKKCHKFMGVSNTEIWFEQESLLDTIPERDLVKRIDDKLNEEYDQVFIPYKSNHVDHKAIYEACLASFRLKDSKRVEKEVYLYEYPFINGYDKIEGGAVYFPITDKMLKDKIKAFYFYQTQVKKAPSPLNEEGIETLSKMRGMEVGVKYAEKYYLRHKIL